MLSFKSFWTARIVLGGIELVHMLRKGRLTPGSPGSTPLSAADAFRKLQATRVTTIHSGQRNRTRAVVHAKAIFDREILAQVAPFELHARLPEETGREDLLDNVLRLQAGERSRAIRATLWHSGAPGCAAADMDMDSQLADHPALELVRMRLPIAALSLAILLIVPQAARTQDKPKTHEPDAYTQAIQRAVDEYSRGHWSEARAFFLVAHGLQPSARTLRGLALASYELRSYVDAITYFERALAEPTQALTGHMREETERFLAESRMFVTTVHVTIEPAGAQLMLDNQPVQLSTDGTLRLDPGAHTLTADAPGYATNSQSLVTRGGAEPLNVVLQLQASGSPAMAQPSEAKPAQTLARGGSLGPWIVIGSAAAVAISGGVFVGVAAANKSSAEHPGSDPSYREVQDAAVRGRVFFPLGFALLGVGAAGIATGIVWKYWPVFGRSERASVSLMPTGLLLHGRF